MALAIAPDKVISGVQLAVADALGLDESEAHPDATLMDELGAESIDLLDILFRLERKFGAKIQASDLATYVQGGIPDEEFGDEQGIITEQGLRQLQLVMPQIDLVALQGTLEAERVMSLFTVQNLADLVATRVAAVYA